MRSLWTLLPMFGILLAARVEAQSLYITEVSAAENWMEIYNAGPEPVRLENWLLCDSGNCLRLSGLLPSHGFKVVTLPFGLKNSGEAVSLRLLEPGGEVVYSHGFNFPFQVGGSTYGFPILGNLVLTNLPSYMAPTPGWRNGEPAPVFPIIVTEILFVPTVVDLLPDERLQFVEVRNIGTEPLDLAGYEFTAGITFTFPSFIVPPGGYALVVSNRLAFELHYGPGLPIAGEFIGRLSAGGETIVLQTPSGAIASTFPYSDRWSPLANGLGHSLVLRDESRAAFALDSSAWRNSTRRGGSPGQPDPPLEVPRVVINEILSRPELPNEKAIELANLEDTSVDLSGWFLSDRRQRPRKFRLPEGTTIGPRGFLAFDEHTFNPDGDFLTSSTFSLNQAGEEIWLFSADRAGALTGYAHGFAFGGSDPDVSFGRILDSTGAELFVPQSDLSFAAANVGPRAEPLVISELYYSGNGNEFIELHNRSGAALSLADPDQPERRWSLAGGVRIAFPPVIVPPDGYAIATEMVPPLFRAVFNIPAEIPIFQWSGSLSKTGEPVELLRTDTLPSDGVTTNVLSLSVVVDRVHYANTFPWPIAARDNIASLHRLDEVTPGSDPANWQAARPSPGQPRAIGDAPVLQTHPAPASPQLGEPAQFAVEAVGPGPLAYQWIRNGLPILGATQSVYQVTSSVPAQVGVYACTVANDFGATSSRGALLNLPEFPLLDVIPPEITLQSPPNTQVTVTGPEIVLAGTARDNRALAAVLVGRAGGPLTVGADSNDWTIRFPLTRPVTRLEIMAIDRAGNVSPTNQLEVSAEQFLGTLSIIGPGTVTGFAHGQVLRVGEHYTATAVPHPFSHFIHWTDGTGQILSDDPTLPVEVAGEVTLTAHFALVPILTLAVSGPGAIVGMTNGQLLKVGERYSATAVANPLARFNHWTSHGGSLVTFEPTFTFEAFENLTLTAHFVALPQLTLQVWGPGAVVGLTNGQLLQAGVVYTGTAVPLPNSEFVHWADGLSRVLSQQRIFSFEASGSSFSLEARFAALSALALSVSGSGGVIGLTNGQLLRVGAYYSATAVPAIGSHFVRWTDGAGRRLSVNSTLNFEATDSMNLTAHFAPNPGGTNLVAALAVWGPGSIVGLTNGQRLEAGQHYTVTAVPDVLSLFTRWSDLAGRPLSTDPTFSFVATSEVKLAAQFMRDPTRSQLALAIVGRGTVTGVTDGQILRHGQSYSVVARPLAGQVFVNWTDAAGHELSRQPRFTFVASQGQSLTAHFVDPDYFADFRGGYIAVFAESQRPDHNHSGSIVVTLGRNGRFSGRLRLGRTSRSFAGSLDTALSGQVTIDPGGAVPRALALQFRRNSPAEAFNASLHSADLNVSFNGHRTVPRGVRAPVSGRFQLTAVALDHLPLAAAIPFELAIQSSGRFTFKGQMPDRLAVRATGVTTASGLTPVHAMLYKGQGSLAGWISAAETATNSLWWNRAPSALDPGFSHTIRFNASPSPGGNFK